MNEWNAIESSWCRTAFRKRVLRAQIAFNCPEFHFLIKASDSLAGSWLEAYEVCPGRQKRNGRPQQPQSTPQGFVLSECSQVQAPAEYGVGGWGRLPLPTPSVHGFQIQAPVRGAHRRSVRIPAHTRSPRSAPSPGALALCIRPEKGVCVRAQSRPHKLMFISLSQ